MVWLLIPKAERVSVEILSEHGEDGYVIATSGFTQASPFHCADYSETVDGAYVNGVAVRMTGAFDVVAA